MKPPTQPSSVKMSISPELYHHIAEQADHTTRLVLRSANSDWLNATAKHLLLCITIENMQLQNVRFAILQALSFRLLPELLESLSVYSGDTIQEIYMRCAQEGPNDSLSIPTLVPMPHLTVLDLQGDAFHVVRSQRWSIDGVSVQEICRNAENLSVLKLASVNRASEAMAAINRLPKLRFLSVTMGPEQSFKSRREGIRFEGRELEQLQVANYHEARVKVVVGKHVAIEARGNVEILQ